MGTNNIQLLIVEKNDDIRIIERKMDVTAFGKHMQDNLATKEALASLQLHLKKYIEISKTFTEDIIIIGTSGARTAHNINIIQDWLREHYQLPLTIISGEEEAFLNGLANKNDFASLEHVLLFDIGGGSTEFTYIKNKQIHAVHTINLGIRYLQNHFQNDFLLKENFTLQQLKPIAVPKEDFFVVGIGGTAISLKELIEHYLALDDVSENKLEKAKIDDFITFLRTASEEEIKNKMNFDVEQTEIISTGTMLIQEILSHFRKDFMLISDKGLQFGFLQLLQDNLIESPIFFKNYIQKAMKNCKLQMQKNEDWEKADR